MRQNRRFFLQSLTSASLVMVPSLAIAQAREIWSVRQAYEALESDNARLLDIRSRKEWRETGVAAGAWPVSMHESGFPKRLQMARELASGRPVAIICSTGGRTRSVMRALKRAGYSGYVDVTEGMMGSPAGRGWIAAGLPVVSLKKALAGMPKALS
ncbi:MAG: rhodanese-like domain-containing protein [Silicimonas sp.]|nr:rhodanese-like domain-containing protein [Silicimonas sp.]